GPGCKRVLHEDEGFRMSNTSTFSKMDKVALKILIGVALASVSSSFGQTKDPYSPTYRPETAKSRAEQDAEQRVALSADKIIDLLRQEPGLLLEAKRVLVRKAYEQGRILDPDDLTDEALFQLLREDQNVRVLVTREIEDRGYIRAKPTRKQIEQERAENGRYAVAAAPSQAQNAADNGLKPSNKEEEYWRKHDDSVPRYPQAPAEQQPVVPSTPAPRMQPPVNNQNPARQLEMANLPNDQDLYDGMGVDSGAAADSGRMSRITPEQLPGLFFSSDPATTSFAMVDGAAQQRDRGASRIPNFGSSGYNLGRDGVFGAQTDGHYASGGGQSFDQQATLEMPHQQLPSAQDLNLD